MSEEDNGYNQTMNELQHRLSLEISSLQIEVSRTFQAIDWRLNPKARSARRELLELRKAIHVEPDNPPKILQVQAGSREYTSVRRVEGKAIYRTKDNSPAGVYEFETIFEIPLQSLPDKSVGILVVPAAVDCQNEELKRRYSPESLHNWHFEAAMAEGVPYKGADWRTSTSSVILVARKGENVYILGSEGTLRGRVWDKFDGQETISSLRPDENGIVRLATESGYLSQSELDAKRSWYDNGARFYVMVEGSADVQRKRSSRSLPELKPAEVTLGNK